ncbi:MAG: RelA/SpoT family protein [Marinilabiliales bacterium]|nr:MAG: RelA/SpoT family protein [Marinilabiliales bacterium]
MKNEKLTTRDREQIIEHFNSLKELCLTFSEDDQLEIQKAFNMAYDAHEDTRRLSGEPYIVHSIEVAKILRSELNLESTSVICGVLHDITKYTSVELDEIQDQFGEAASHIIAGLKKIEGLYTQKASLHADNFIKLLLNLSNDVRIILVKLADRLHNMRTLWAVDMDVQEKVALETKKLYAPIAHRLGLYRIKVELEELSMKYSESDIYHSIQNKLKETRDDLDEYIQKFISPINKELDKQGFKFDIKGRVKAISSIWKKMQAQEVDFSEVYDLFAIRIILHSKPEKEKDDCWKVYSIITNKYQPNPKRLRDWISAPKSSGYESLHTTVLGPENKWVEVQIRTQRMDEIAEKGYAAHWIYKKTGSQDDRAGWLHQIREILEKPQPEVKKISEAKEELYSDKIFVFTPQGDLIALAAGATVLDFAYAVHTKVGHTCTGAKVNNTIVPLKHVLSNGEQVEILTGKNQKPKLDWLNWVSSPRSKAKIKRALKDIEYQQAETGRDILKHKLGQINIAFNDEVVKKLIKHFNRENQHDLYQAIATDKITLSELKEAIVDDKPQKSLPPIVKRTAAKTSDIHKTNERHLVVDENPSIRDFQLAKCCKPIPGDKVFAFVTVNKGINIHRDNCPNAVQMKELYPYRILQADWQLVDETQDFIAFVKVSGSDKVGMLTEISQIISSEMNINMRNLSFTGEDDKFIGHIELFVKDQKHLDGLIARIKTIDGVEKVQRER